MASLNIIAKVEDYGNRVIKLLNSHIKYYQIAAFENVMHILTMFISKVILIGTALLSSVFLSVWLAFTIGEFAGKISLGFLAVGFLYLAGGLLIYSNRTKWIIDPMVSELSKLIVKEQMEEDEGA